MCTLGLLGKCQAGPAWAGPVAINWPRALPVPPGVPLELAICTRAIAERAPWAPMPPPCMASVLAAGTRTMAASQGESPRSSAVGPGGPAQGTQSRSHLGYHSAHQS